MMGIHDFPGNGKPQAEMPGVLAGGIPPVEAIEQMGFSVVRYSRSIVGNADEGYFVLLAQGEGNPASGRTEAEGIMK